MENDYKPNPKAFVDNLKGPMPIQKKLFLFLKNNARKIVTAKSCCGHPGEPGC
jgi:hypothetical protein